MARLRSASRISRLICKVGCAVALVAMGHRPRPPMLHRKSGQGRVQRLDRTLFVKAEHNCVPQRIQVHSDDILKFFFKVRIVALLEGPNQVGLQASRLPHTMHETMRCTDCMTHRPIRPVRRVVRQITLLLNFAYSFEHFRYDSSPGTLLHDPCQSLRGVPLTPADIFTLRLINSRRA